MTNSEMTKSFERPTWDETWLSVAAAVARRSWCVNSKVGAVIVDASGRVDSTGYNGPPAGLQVEGECSNWCPRASRGEGSGTASYSACAAVHAEANALLHADATVIKGGTIYITRAPCKDCAKLIANSGLAVVVASFDESDDPARSYSTFEYLKSCGLRARYYVRNN